MNIKQYKEKIASSYTDDDKNEVYEEMFSKNITIENEEEWLLYDEMLIDYWGDNVSISNDMMKNVFNHLKNNLPNNKSIEDTKAYDRMLSVVYSKITYNEVFPERNAEEIFNRLVNLESDLLNKDGSIKDVKKYDRLLREYIQFFGNEKDLSDLKICFDKLLNNSEFKNSDIDTVTSYRCMKLEYEYASTSKKEEIFSLMGNYKNRIAADCLAKFYENDRRSF